MKLLRMNRADDIVVVPVDQVTAVINGQGYVQVLTVNGSCFYVDETFEDIIKALSDA